MKITHKQKERPAETKPQHEKHAKAKGGLAETSAQQQNCTQTKIYVPKAAEASEQQENGTIKKMKQTKKAESPYARIRQHDNKKARSIRHD